MKYPTEKQLQNFKDDRFEYKELSKKILDEVLMEMETPNCFGLYGNWGSGKSTMIQYIKEHLNRGRRQAYKDITTVYFEPWRYEYSDQNDLLFALLSCIKGELKINNAKWKKLAVDTLAIGSHFLKVAKIVDMQSVDRDAKLLEGKIFKEHEQWVDNVEELRKDFDESINSELEKECKKKLIVFIDDLDRCLPENSVKLLEAMKNFLSVKNVLFVLAIDRRIIGEMVEKKYGLHAGYGEEYLTKIVPYYYELSGNNHGDIIGKILKAHSIDCREDQLEWINNFVKKFSIEPRVLKHLINQMCMSVILIKRVEDFMQDRQGNNQVQYLFIAIFLLFKFPKLFSTEVGGVVRSIYNSFAQNKANYSKSLMRYEWIDSRERKYIENVMQESNGIGSQYAIFITELAKIMESIKGV